MEAHSKLHIAVFPWLAMGHLIPFQRLSIVLAQKGLSVSFISTPQNLSRLPQFPQRLSSSISLISLPLPPISDSENTIDIPYVKQQLLKKAFDLLQPPLTTFLQSSKPDWVIYDYASHWLPSVCSDLGIPAAFFSLFTAAALSFIGPPSLLMAGGDPRSTAADFAAVPDWIPIESDIKYRIHEVTKYVEKTEEDETGPTDSVRFGFAIGKADVVIFRSSPELEPEWFDVFGKLTGKPVIPIGFLPPLIEDSEEENRDELWLEIEQWLNKKEPKSVVYVALGTEASLTGEEVERLAIGLEKSGSDFIWALKSPPGSTRSIQEMLPAEFEERVKSRGLVLTGWVPQVKILSHDSVGVFLTHCGWNSVIEGLSLNKVLILFPVLNDQGLNARLLQGKRLGFEVPRDEIDGEFTSDSVAELVSKAKVSSPDELGNEMSLFGDRVRNNRFVDEVVGYLRQNRKSWSNTSIYFGKCS